jgi:nicotinamide N-methyltransferase
MLPEESRSKGFQTVILADLLFNHSEHAKLIKSVEQTLEKDVNACALVFFTPYRPWLLEKDLAFFDLARENNFQVKQIFEKVMDKVLFEKDPGVRPSSSVSIYYTNIIKDELLRRTVYGYELKWSTS